MSVSFFKKVFHHNKISCFFQSVADFISYYYSWHLFLGNCYNLQISITSFHVKSFYWTWLFGFGDAFLHFFFFMYECSYDIEHQRFATDLKFSNNISVTHWNPGHELQCRLFNQGSFANQIIMLIETKVFTFQSAALKLQSTEQMRKISCDLWF